MALKGKVPHLAIVHICRARLFSMGLVHCTIQTMDADKLGSLLSSTLSIIRPSSRLPDAAEFQSIDVDQGPLPNGEIDRWLARASWENNERVRDLLARRQRVAGRGTRRFSMEIVYGEFGLLRLERLPLNAPT
jgi:hypothetical protein